MSKIIFSFSLCQLEVMVMHTLPVGIKNFEVSSCDSTRLVTIKSIHVSNVTKRSKFINWIAKAEASKCQYFDLYWQ